MPDPSDLTLAQASRAIAARELSPVALVEAALARITDQEPAVNAFVSVWAESARRQALQAEQDIARGAYRDRQQAHSRAGPAPPHDFIRMEID